MSEHELRWFECDGHHDPIQRLDCRTSKLNDGFHALELNVMRLSDGQREMRREASANARTIKLLTTVGAITAAVAPVAAKIIMDVLKP